MESQIKFGCDKSTVDVMRKSIMDILECRADQETIRLALNCLKESCSIGDISISNSSFNCNMPNEVYKTEPGNTLDNK